MQSPFSVTVVESSAKCLEILQSYLEKSGNFILPNLWEPCQTSVGDMLVSVI